MLRKYLQLTRAHSAPLEAVPAYIGAVLATGSPLGNEALIWAGLGVLYHLAGYGMNSYSDWRAGYDKNDPYKQHHPLNKGEISGPAAFAVSVTLTVALVAAIVHFASGQAILIMIAGIIGGLAYNFYGKEEFAKPLFIAAAHTTMFIMPYITYNGGMDVFGVLCSVAIFFWVVYQIAIGGEILALPSKNEQTIIQMLGGRLAETERAKAYFGPPQVVSEYYYPSAKVMYVGGALRFFIGLILSVLAYQHSGAEAFFTVYALGLASIYLEFKINKRQWYVRSKMMRKIVLIEAINLFMLAGVAIKELTFIGWVVICSISFLWVVIGNKIEWGSFLNPKV